LTGLEGFAAHDRVLVAAPHPDDESLATAGVLQAAAAAGAALRVLVMTDGDNNPWPQRWIEKRWHIGPAERARWGARRRAEAQAALGVLGIGASDTRFFGLPDLGLTDVLMRGNPDLVTDLTDELARFRPTRLFLPAVADRHPDHSALHVLLRLALARAGGAMPRLHAFGVHKAADGGHSEALALSTAQRERKREAILQHATQMRLSGRRFLAYAREQEIFSGVTVPAAPEAAHPLQSTVDASGHLDVHIDTRDLGGRLAKQSLFVVIERGTNAQAGFVMAFSGAGGVRLFDAASGRAVGEPIVGQRGDTTTVHLPVQAGPGWMKIGAAVPGLFVLDRHGWQPLTAS
jgi:LmbE family N-acetylglucosaminyl deacetylase